MIRNKMLRAVVPLLAATLLGGCDVDDDLSTNFNRPPDTAPGTATPSLAVLLEGNRLLRTFATNPGATFDVEPIAIQNLDNAEVVLAIDYRPATGVLYALTQPAANFARLRTIDAAGTASTAIGGDFALTGTAVGMDFDPILDVIRVVSDAEENLRVNPDTGAVTTDTALSPAADVVGAGYTNSFSGAPANSNTLFVIDTAQDRLLMQGTINNTASQHGGALTAVGNFGVAVGAEAGFDIDAVSGTAYLGSGTTLYTVSLATGAAASVGRIWKGTAQVLDISVVPPTTPRVFAVNAANELIAFDIASPATVETIAAITIDHDRKATTDPVPLATGESILAMDFRPAAITTGTFRAGQLFALSSLNCLYIVDLTTAVATPFDLVANNADKPETLGVQCAFDTVADHDSDPATPDEPIGPSLSGTHFAMAFDPTADQIRVIGNDGQNLRLDPASGRVIDAVPDDEADPSTLGVQTDGAVAAGVTSAAYTNDFPTGLRTAEAGSATTLFGLDTTGHQLVRIGDVDGDPNGAETGTTTPIGALGVSLSDVGGFDIIGGNARSAGGEYLNNLGFAIASTDGSPNVANLYRVNLNTGAATLLNPVGTGNVDIRAATVRVTGP